MDILSMNKLRGLDELEIHQIPKDFELISKINKIKTSQSEMNGALLQNIRKQELYKEHALNLLKYIQIFLHHILIIKNEYDILEQNDNSEDGDDKDAHTKQSTIKLQSSWNKYENNETHINLNNEYYSIYEILNKIKSENKDLLKILYETFNKLYKTDEFFSNSQDIIALLSELQFQIDDDATVYSEYTKIFTGRQYLDLMKSMFYFYIERVIQFIKNEFYSIRGTDNLSSNGQAILSLFNQIMRDIIFEKINDLYVLDKRTDGEIQEELDRQKALSNEKRKKAFDRNNQSEKIIYALRRSQNLGNVFQDITEAVERENENSLVDLAFTAGLTAEMFMTNQEDDYANSSEYAGIYPLKDGVDESEFAVPDMDGDDFDAYN